MNERLCGNEDIQIQTKKRSNIKSYISVAVVSSLLTSSLVGGGLYYKFSSDLKNMTITASKYTDAVAGSEIQSEVSGSPEVMKTYIYRTAVVPQIAKKVGPSIVGIKTTLQGQKRNLWFDVPSDSVEEGSGVIISQDGYIMTNYHVVAQSDPKSGMSKNTTMEVFLPDKRQAKATFIGGDEKSDLAVVKIDLDNLPVAELGDSSRLDVGETVVAIGNPLGMEFAGSVTVGVVSALNRKIDIEDKTLNLIQTDAAINPGNSGGALVNSMGKVIGINTVKISVSGVEGLGFAIPINDAKPIVDQLTLFGYVKGRPYMGISGQDITESISKQYDLPIGIYIVKVGPDTAADKAGLKKGDILVAMDGVEIKNLKKLDEIKSKHKAGDTVNVTVIRNGDKIDLRITFSEEM
jgi:serine protease Do